MHHIPDPENTSHQQWVTSHPCVFSNSETELWWFSSKRWKFYWNLSPPSTSWPAKSRGEMQNNCILRSLSISFCFSAHKKFVPRSLWITWLLRQVRHHHKYTQIIATISFFWDPAPSSSFPNAKVKSGLLSNSTSWRSALHGPCDLEVKEDEPRS